MKIRFAARRLLFAFCLLLCASASMLQAQPDTWVTSFGSVLQDAPEDILVDDAGNSYISGYFRDTLHIGSVELASAGKNDVFLAKFDPDGQLLWANRYGWFSNEFAHGLAFDKLGNVLMVGEYQDSTIFETDTLFSDDTLWYGPPALTYDVFWVRVLPSTGAMDTVWADGWFGSENFYEVSVGEDSLYYFAGMYRTFNYWTNPFHYDPRDFGKGYDDAIWVRSNAHGFMDHKAIAMGKYIDKAMAIDLIGDSLVVMGGTFQDTCYFVDPSVYYTAGFDDDLFLACYSDTGRYVWAIAGGSKGVDKVTAVITDPQGNTYMSGQFDSLLTLGGMTLQGSLNLDGFVAKVAIDGTVQWLKGFGGIGFDGVEDVRLTAAGDVLVTGYFQREMQLDGGFGAVAYDTTDQNAYVALINNAGSTQWVRSLGGDGPDLGKALDEDAAGYIYAVGTYSATGHFGQVTTTSGGAEDIYLLRMSSDGSVIAPEGQTLPLGQVELWPNPTQDLLNIRFDLAQASAVDIDVMDLSGRLLHRQSMPRRAAGQVVAQTSLAELPAGLYLLRIQSSEGSFSAKVAVTH